MSALPPKADIAEREWDVRFVPKGDIDRSRLFSRQADVDYEIWRAIFGKS